MTIVPIPHKLPVIKIEAYCNDVVKMAHYFRRVYENIIEMNAIDVNPRYVTLSDFYVKSIHKYISSPKTPPKKGVYKISFPLHIAVHLLYIKTDELNVIRGKIHQAMINLNHKTMSEL